MSVSTTTQVVTSFPSLEIDGDVVVVSGISVVMFVACVGSCGVLEALMVVLVVQGSRV